ncbi:MAG: glycosyltransferase family 2 protein [Gemmatimonadaceae bacterium]
MTSGLVRVILSTYNSERFIRPLVDSVLAQTHAPLELWVRDDGSRDATPEILRDYATRHPERVHLELGPNIGMVDSYFSVIRAAGRDAEYTAFCDHDDVWHPGKVARAVEVLRAHGGAAPLMYTGRLRIMDHAGVHIGGSLLPSRELSFRNALVENVAAACTMVMNQAARDLLLTQQNLGGVVWPDWWFYLLVSAFGTVLYDETPWVDYRRHGGNAVGSPTGWRRVQEGWRIVRRGQLPTRLLAQARALRREFGSRLPESSRTALAEFLDRPASLAGRARHAATCGVYRQRAIDGAVIRLLLLTAGDRP